MENLEKKTIHYFYDKKIGVFLVEGVHLIPDDAIKVDEQNVQNLIDARAEGGIIYVKDGTVKVSPTRPSNAHEWFIENEQWILNENKLSELKNSQYEQVKQSINALRDECVNGGVYVPAIDKWVDTDEKGRSTLVEIKADFDLNGKDNIYTLICADNTARTITFGDFKAVWDAVKNLKERMFENAYMHKVLLAAAEDPLDYDYSIGWVTTYQNWLREQNDD